MQPTARASLQPVTTDSPKWGGAQPMLRRWADQWCGLMSTVLRPILGWPFLVWLSTFCSLLQVSTGGKCGNDNNNVLFHVLFLQIGARSPLQSKEQNIVKTNFHGHA